METKKYRVLIVEDERPLAQMLCDKLAREGFDAKMAKDGQEGLAIALDWQPDLILLDLLMPNMDGMTMLRKLRSDPVGKTMRVILLTNLSDTQKVYEAMTYDVRDYLVKTNWDLDDIIKEIRTKLSFTKKPGKGLVA